MNGVKKSDKSRVELKGIVLNKWQGITRLRLNVNPDDIETSPAVTDTGAARTAEQIEQSRLPRGCLNRIIAIEQGVHSKVFIVSTRKSADPPIWFRVSTFF